MDDVKFKERDVVRTKGHKMEMEVLTHAGGTVRVKWYDEGIYKEANYSAYQLELVRRLEE